MKLPTAQEKSEQIFFTQPVCRGKNKTVTTDLLWLITFFEQCQAANKMVGILDKIKENKQPKEKKMAHLHIACSSESSYQQHHCKNRNYQQSIGHYWDDQWHDSHHQDDWCYKYSHCKDKNYKNKKSYKKKDDCKQNHFKKIGDKAMHNDQSSSSSSDTLSRKRSRSCSRSPSCSCFHSCCSLSSSRRSYTNHHVSHDDRKSSGPPKHKYLYSSEDDDDGRFHLPNKSNTVFTTFATPKVKKSKCTPK